MTYGTCDGCGVYTVFDPLTKIYSEYWKKHIFLCNDCVNDPTLDREAVASGVE